MELDRMIQFREFSDGEASWHEGIFSVTFYPLGNAEAFVTEYVYNGETDADVLGKYAQFINGLAYKN